MLSILDDKQDLRFLFLAMHKTVELPNLYEEALELMHTNKFVIIARGFPSGGHNIADALLTVTMS